MTIIYWMLLRKKMKLLKSKMISIPEIPASFMETGSDNPHALWTCCEFCGVVLHKRALKGFFGICPYCNFHHQLTSDERIAFLLDKNTWYPLNELISPRDPLKFKDQKSYTRRIGIAQTYTGITDAVQTGTGFLNKQPVALGVMDFNFMGGSMGSVVGEKLTRLIEYATKKRLYLVIICTSGGARMQEGVLSLMQMAKISAALHIYQNIAKLLYISICTSPTTGGITASFAMLGNIILAEPRALIGFAGRRVIALTLREELPRGFQTSEYLLKYGHIDAVISRIFLKEALSEIFELFSKTIYKKYDFINEDKFKQIIMNYNNNDYGVFQYYRKKIKNNNVNKKLLLNKNTIYNSKKRKK
uniref:Acetyl-coenzyme A carboxylase carboxyl transferase subunit beta, chloroplastic n=1 Tax=Prototheca stagnorum TaxID=215448 RepID=A0A2Z6BEN8_9CHLO|nr:beta subunit of acetyl-carboxylase, carboxyltransferase [Prototheca stagnorum]BBD20193.1 beta subunit of acetyl-carboxylase, carboxyltransferase [Prototheca stagnorum]